MIDKIKGSLVGGAIGDALGYAVEFSSAYEIFRRYGDGGIVEYDLTKGQAIISDDTQMTMFTAEGLLRAKEKYVTPTVEEYVKEIYQSYLDWLKTQTVRYNPNKVYESSKLLNIKELYSQRAPGGTCLSALESGRCGSFECRLNNSKGCGGVMRVAPIALLLAPNREISERTIDTISARASAITHSHELGYIPSSFVTNVISGILRGKELKQAVLDAKAFMYELFDKSKNLDYFIKLIDKAIDLAFDKSVKADIDAIYVLGEGWVAEETAAIAIYCALKYENDFEKAIVASVNHDGDSDSTGAVTGNIMGALVGYSKIPEKYTESLELKNELINLAQELYSMQ